jgi:hypothetical protein
MLMPLATRKFVATVLLASALAGCSQNQGLLENGLGSALPGSDTATSGELLDAYYELLCHQAGIGEKQACNIPGVGDPNWTLIVRQGMNDIDRRCDAYLQWLDNVKRSKQPLLSQVSAVQASATGIIGVIEPRSTQAITILSQAFSLITKSIENYYSRLLLEVEQSTINSVVLRAQQDFRSSTRDQVYLYRPDAEHVLRSYLRLCLPFSIETRINDYSTLGSQGIKVGRDSSINAIPDVGVDVNVYRELSAAEPVKQVRRARVGVPGGDPKTGDIDIDDPSMRTFQAALCAPIDGRLGPATRAYIRDYQANTYSGSSNARVTGTLGNAEKSSLRGLGKCTSPFKTYTERNTFKDQNGLKEFAAALGKPDATDLSELREAIRAKRLELGLDNGPDGAFADSVTYELLEKMNFI